MSTTPTPGGVTATAKGDVKADAEVVKKKNSMRFSPRLMDPAHKLAEEGFTYACIDVASNAVVKGFTNEDDCQAYCAERNAQ